MDSILKRMVKERLNRFAGHGSNLDRSQTGMTWDQKTFGLFVALQKKYHKNGYIPKRKCEMGLPIFGILIREMVDIAIEKDMFPGKTENQIERGIRQSLSKIRKKAQYRASHGWVTPVFKCTLGILKEIEDFYFEKKITHEGEFMGSVENGGWFIDLEDEDSPYLQEMFETMRILTGGKKNWWVYFLNEVFA